MDLGRRLVKIIVVVSSMVDIMLLVNIFITMSRRESNEGKPNKKKRQRIDNQPNE